VTQKLPTLNEAVDAYQQLGHRLWSGDPLDPRDVEMFGRLSTSKEAARAFAALALLESKGLIFVDDCVEAQRLYTGKHKAQVERLGRAPDYNKTLAKLESLVKDYGVLSEDVREAFGVIRCDLYYRDLHHQYDRRSKSRKGDEFSASSRAIGCLKESVHRLSEKPNLKHVMTLGDAVLNTDEPISLDAVKRAVTPSEWLNKRF
jgi:hypothetical protein